MKILLLYNPFSGHKRANKLLPQAKSLLREHNIDFDLFLTRYPGHGMEIVSKADFEKYDGLVAAGGDGILFEAVNGYFNNPSPKKIPIGVLPMGTGNAFALELNLEVSRWHEAIAIIEQKKTRKVDVGRFFTQNQDYYFLNILGVGFVADVIETAKKLKFLGASAYNLGIFYRTIFLNSHKLILEIDGDVIERESTFVEISNTRYTGNLLMMAPNAIIDDGLFDITLLGKVNRRKLLQSFPKIFTGDHIHEEEVETFRAKKIKIQCDDIKPLAPDGELLGATPVEIECLPKAIEVFWK